VKFTRIQIKVFGDNGRVASKDLTLPEPLSRDDLAFQSQAIIRTIARFPDPIRLSCAYCGESWTHQPDWGNGSAPSPYCPDHRKAKSREQSEPICPTPDKRAFNQEHQAMNWALFSSGGTGKGMKVYRCPCRKYHITSSPAHSKALVD